VTGRFTREQAADAVEIATGERDAIQANLLELDGSFGKGLLAGAQLTGTSRDQWNSATTTLTALWELYVRYSDVVDQAAQAIARHHRLPRHGELERVTELLTEPCIEITGEKKPLAERDLVRRGQTEWITVAAAVGRMRLAFAAVSQVTCAAEQVWNQVSARLDRLAIQLDAVGPASQEAAPLCAELDRLRAAVSTDPLAFWQPSGQVAMSGLDELHERLATFVSPGDQGPQP
jgi:hypothetical protein